MNKLSLLTMIINHSQEEEFIDFLQDKKAGFKNIIRATGTASDSVLDYFGLNEIKKCIILSVVPYNMSKYILKQLKEDKKIKIDEPGNGIAFTIPLSSGTQYMIDRYKDIEVEDIDMKPANQHLIITIANEGSAETIMASAKKAGATGGTTINGRGLEPNKIVKVLGLSLEPEKDVVLILAPDNIKNKIMEKIIEKCGSHKEQAGLCFSIPVDHAAGINIDIED
ncbi:MAG: hypothetical protein ACI4OP_04565 [Candidatus Coprovivens sp.]